MIYVKQNDTKPAASATLQRGSSVVVLTDAASVAFVMKLANGTIKVNAAATIDDAAGGEVSYAWQVGDTDIPGMHLAQWTVTWNDGGTETFPTIGSDIVLIPGSLTS